ncbi:unnamed protein product [Clonostachys solani]|uniref:Uncharacterized protein n=1 Tax=Clonostachys solani TaxID=160281 RepID=A0A9P0ECX7_9HYPO|nr:unnamed protein product [Clonostachys solani]
MPDDRFWVFSICTPYGDVLVNIGNLEAHLPGKYLMKYDNREYGLDTKNPPAGFVGLIKFPMAYGLSNMRILTSRTNEDLAAIWALQAGFSVEAQDRPGNPVAPALNFSMFRSQEYLPGVNQTFEEAVLKVAAKIAAYNPPYVTGDRLWVKTKLAKAGFKNDEFIQPKGSDIGLAVASANETVEQFTAKPGVLHDVGNGWVIHDHQYIGLYNSNYEMRYQVASYLYLGLADDQCVYPSRAEEISVDQGKSILFTFAAVPKIKEGGFWSLTAYGPDQDLIENDLNRYSLGDRDALTFPDGSLVSDGEGSFQVLLQATDIEPPANWTSNWLPITAGGSNITVTLRWAEV